MSGINSLEYRLEKFIDGFSRSGKDGHPIETWSEALARAIVREFGKELQSTKESANA